MTRFSVIAALAATDGYKTGHEKFMPPGTKRQQNNWTNRSSRLPGVNKVVHFGLQAFCQKYLVEAFEDFFAADVEVVVTEYSDLLKEYLNVESVNTDHVRALHKLQYVPLRFSAVPEGTLVPIGVPSFIYENTVDGFGWVVGYIETILSASYWHPSTTATIANEYRRFLEKWAERTGADPAAVLFQAHDFSFRGQTSLESAEASGAGHLLSFLGTDTIPSIFFARQYYPGDNGLIGCSVPATEHSVMCAGTREGELATFRHILREVPTGIVSIVSDTWNLWDVLTKILPALKDEILARPEGSKLVIRPDSGDPEKIICGDFAAPPGSLEALGMIEILGQTFGYTVNEAGYKELHPKIGAIYGDSITLERLDSICRHLKANGWASTNVVFGVGSFTYQYNTRDTVSSAVKATWILVGDEERDLQKDPITDDGTKKSATGRLAAQHDANGEMYLIQKATPEQEEQSLYKTVWEDGKPVIVQSFADVRGVLDGERSKMPSIV